MDPQPMQFPVDIDKAGLYRWTLQHPDGKLHGHIVLRGPEADPIPSFPDAEKGMEYWFTGEGKGGGSDPGTFVVKLLMERYPDDPELDAAIAEVQQTQEQFGTADMVPEWQPGAPLPPEAVIYTETEVVNGPGDYEDLYTNVSLLLPVSDGVPVMPTWYTSIGELFSIFGGSPETGAPIAEGITATFGQISEGEEGWPDPDTWSWYGRDPD